jgi:hypothetical protein
MKALPGGNDPDVSSLSRSTRRCGEEYDRAFIHGPGGHTTIPLPLGQGDVQLCSVTVATKDISEELEKRLYALGCVKSIDRHGVVEISGDSWDELQQRVAEVGRVVGGSQ